MTVRLALVGNPNAGKSTIFNALTGANQRVGNWPGKTVERKAGTFHIDEQTYEIVDLPGTYSLNAFSMEETITRDYLLDDPLDGLVLVLDAVQLERNLYLAVQTLELGLPTVVVLNMADVLKTKGITINVDVLSAALGAPVVCTAANQGKGLDDLQNVLKTFLRLPERARPGFSPVSLPPSDVNRGGNLLQLPGVKVSPPLIPYPPQIARAMQSIEAQVMAYPEIAARYPVAWVALKSLEADPDMQTRLHALDTGKNVSDAIQQIVDEAQEAFPDDLDILIAESRYQWINALVTQAQTVPADTGPTLGERVDRIVLHRVWGIPVFFAAMWVVFSMTANVSAPYLDWIDTVLSGPFTHWTVALLGWVGLQGTWFESLLVDGLIGGVGGVLVFIPVLVTLYITLGILEDSGYMARAAYVMDGLMRKLGLHGKSFLPMMVGFGCSVPAIYATRTLENERDRILTGLLVPFMSCGARLPVYVLFATIFFPRNQGLIVFSMYFLGILTAIGLGMILRRTVFKAEEQSPFIMEIPPYRRPTLKGIGYQVWRRTSAFIRDASTIILGTSMVIWLLMSIPAVPDETFASVPLDKSAFAWVNQKIAPVFDPVGFGSWEASGALMTGLVAKEVVVTTMSQIYGVPLEQDAADMSPTSFRSDFAEVFLSFGQATLDTLRAIPSVIGINLTAGDDASTATSFTRAVRENFNETSGGRGALAAFAFMVFVLLYTPCMATIAAEKQELGGKWAGASLIGQFIIAWLVAMGIYQFGVLFLS